MRPHALAPVALFACTPDFTAKPDGGNGPGPGPDTAAPPDSGPDDTDDTDDTDDSADSGGTTDTADTGDTGEEPETWPRACAPLYDQDTLQSFALDFSPEAWSQVQNDCWAGAQVWRPARFTHEGSTQDVHVRLKGNWSWSCDKMQFVVSFNHPDDDPEGRYQGLRKLVLDAPWYDHSLVHERLAFPLFAARGLPYSCANNARLDVNGAYYGLYANVERLDKEYLQRHFEGDDADGNLYQGGVELETNEDIADTSRLLMLQSAATVAEIEALVDLDQAVTEWATEALIPAIDNYWAGVEINYYLYDHPTRGFLYLPYDMDITFGDAAWGDGSPLAPDAWRLDPILHEHSGWRKEPLLMRVLSDPYWCERFREELANSLAVWDPAALSAQVDAWDAQIRPSLVDDPRRPFSVAHHDAAIAHLHDFFIRRGDFVDAWLAEDGHCPAPW